MPSGVKIKPELLRWARGRVHLDVADLEPHYPRYAEWETGDRNPTMRQLEDFANRTHTPLGYLFLSDPPEEKLPIPDFRTLKDSAVSTPSPDLLETIYLMQQRQAWAREYLVEIGADPLEFVGSITLADKVESVAEQIRLELSLVDNWASKYLAWTAALVALMKRIEDVGIMVMTNGVVGDNTHRPLDVGEFRGFVLCDEYAPLVFLNNRDAKSAQMFTLAHELVHVWLGAGGVLNLDQTLPSNHDIERFCNRVAAEILLPRLVFEKAWHNVADNPARFELIARTFKVSRIVAARRALDLRKVKREAFFSYYDKCQKEDARTHSDDGGGGDYYNTKHRKLGDRFSRLVYEAIQGQRLMFGEAFRLTGMRGRTFDKFMTQFGGPE